MRVMFAFSVTVRLAFAAFVLGLTAGLTLGYRVVIDPAGPVREPAAGTAISATGAPTLDGLVRLS